MQHLLEGNFADQQGTAPIINKIFLITVKGCSEMVTRRRTDVEIPMAKLLKSAINGRSEENFIQDRGVIKLELYDEKRADASVDKKDQPS